MSELSHVELKDVDFLSLKELISLFLKRKVVFFFNSRITFFILSMTFKMKREEAVPLATCGSHEAFTVIVECIE